MQVQQIEKKLITCRLRINHRLLSDLGTLPRGYPGLTAIPIQFRGRFVKATLHQRRLLFRSGRQGRYPDRYQTSTGFDGHGVGYGYTYGRTAILVVTVALRCPHLHGFTPEAHFARGATRRFVELGVAVVFKDFYHAHFLAVCEKKDAL